MPSVQACSLRTEEWSTLSLAGTRSSSFGVRDDGDDVSMAKIHDISLDAPIDAR